MSSLYRYMSLPAILHHSSHLQCSKSKGEIQSLGVMCARLLGWKVVLDVGDFHVFSILVVGTELQHQSSDMILNLLLAHFLHHLRHPREVREIFNNHLKKYEKLKYEVFFFSQDTFTVGKDKTIVHLLTHSRRCDHVMEIFCSHWMLSSHVMITPSQHVLHSYVLIAVASV